VKIKSFLLISTFGSALFANIQNIQTLESNFTQSVTNEQNAKVTYKGKLYANKKSNNALWEYNSPVVKKIYYDGKDKLTIIEPELEQVIFAKLHEVPNLLKILSDAKKDAKGILKTKFDGISYTIKTDGDKIDSISYKDKMQNRVLIKFSEEKLNQKIDNSTFRYSIPKEYDIIEQ